MKKQALVLMFLLLSVCWLSSLEDRLVKADDLSGNRGDSEKVIKDLRLIVTKSSCRKIDEDGKKSYVMVGDRGFPERFPIEFKIVDSATTGITLQSSSGDTSNELKYSWSDDFSQDLTVTVKTVEISHLGLEADLKKDVGLRISATFKDDMLPRVVSFAELAVLAKDRRAYVQIGSCEGDDDVDLKTARPILRMSISETKTLQN